MSDRILRRVLCALLALLLAGTACAEQLLDQALNDLTGADQGTDQTLGDIWGDATWAEQTYVAPSINMDADICLGYVAELNCEINPFVCNSRDLVSLNQLVFESVVELDEEGKPAPLLADSWSVEDKKWTFKLREGVVFHNGWRARAIPITRACR